MKTTRFAHALFAVALLSLAACDVVPQQATPTPVAPLSPTLTFRGDLRHTGFYGAQGLAKPSGLLWTFQAGGSIYSTPAIYNNMAFFGTSDVAPTPVPSGVPTPTAPPIQIQQGVAPGTGVFFAVDIATGKERWRLQTEGKILSSPAVADGLVYIGSTDHNLYAVDATSGQVKWKFAAGNEVRTSPAVQNGIVYFGSEDKNVYALDAATGAKKWTFATQGGVFSSPAVANGFVYAGSKDGSVYTLDAASGVAKWTFRSDNSVLASPVVSSDGTLYVASLAGTVTALDAVTGAKKWEKKLESRIAMSPALTDGLLLVGGIDGPFHALDAATGADKWQVAISPHLSSPSVAGRAVYLGGDTLTAYDLHTGSLLWAHPTADVIQAAPALLDGVLYIGDLKGSLYALH